jgi:hypothetical protein
VTAKTTQRLILNSTKHGKLYIYQNLAWEILLPFQNDLVIV